MNKKQIVSEISLEKLLFGEYNVGVYEKQELLTKHKYYCINLDVALKTVDVLKERYPEATVKFYD